MLTEVLERFFNKTLQLLALLCLVHLPLLSYANTNLIEHLQEAIQNQHTYSLEELFQLVEHSNLIMFGETHVMGAEQDAIKAVSEKVLNNLSTKTLCGIESVNKSNHLLSTKAKIKEVFERSCTKVEAIYNNHPSNTNFTKFLKASSEGNSKIITYTGFRHIIPWGKLFPNDFGVAPIDIKTNQTISTQIPKKFKDNSNTLISISFLPREILYINTIKSLIRNYSSFDRYTMRAKMHELSTQIMSYKEQSFLKFEENEAFKIISLDSISTKNEKHVVVLYKSGENSIDIETRLIDLLSSYKFLNFITSFSKVTLVDDYVDFFKRTPNTQLMKVFLVQNTYKLHEDTDSANYTLLEKGSVIIHGFAPGKRVRILYIDGNNHIEVIDPNQVSWSTYLLSFFGRFSFN